MNSSSTDAKQIRKFGLIAVLLFGCLCALGIWRSKPLPAYLFGCLALIGLGFILAPVRLRALYIGWLKVAHTIGIIITTTVLTLAYYLAVTPTGLIKRMFGGHPLPVKPDKGVASYWVARTEPVQPKERFAKRY
jgi:hypothetical protein